MKVTDFDYALPKERIAQHPVEPRDHSRLLVVDKTTGEMEHRHFYNLPEYLKPGDLLVFNDIFAPATYWYLTIPASYLPACSAIKIPEPMWKCFC